MRTADRGDDGERIADVSYDGQGCSISQASTSVLTDQVIGQSVGDALATVTSQWLPNWNRGMARVQRAERLAMGLDRIVADLSVAEMLPINGDAKTPLVGDET